MRIFFCPLWPSLFFPDILTAMKGFSIFLLLVLHLSLITGQDIRFVPGEYVLEKEEESSLFSDGISVTVENLSEKDITLRFIPPRPELKAEPPVITFNGRGTETVFFSWEGEVPPGGERILPVILLARGGTAPERFMIYSPLDYGDSAAGDVRGDYDRRLVYYYSPACRDCREFLEVEIPRIERETGLSIGLERVNIYEEDGMARLRERLDKAGISTDALPILDTGDVILTGDAMIRESLETVLKGGAVSGEIGDGPTPPRAPLWVLVCAAGLLDGINPCAFSTLIFLLAYLGLRKRERREILKVGIFFTLTVFATYTAVGAGAFLFLRKSLSFGWISAALRWGGAAVLVLLGLLSLRDWFRIRGGHPSDMTLQLSPGMKRAVHRSIRGGVRSSLPLAGACAMGFLVTIYELGCTGQIYLPTLYLMIRRGEGNGIFLLLLYNLAFIIPLAVVFILAYRGLTSERLGLWFRERVGTVKILTALFFLAAAGLVIFL